MITAGGTDDGRPMLLLGLSRAECGQLLAGEPIRVHPGIVGVPGLVVHIIGGETEDAIVAALAPLCGPLTLRRDLRTGPADWARP